MEGFQWCYPTTYFHLWTFLYSTPHPPTDSLTFNHDSHETSTQILNLTPTSVLTRLCLYLNPSPSPSSNLNLGPVQGWTSNGWSIWNYSPSLSGAKSV